MVSQQTFNLPVPGSSPGGPTNLLKHKKPLQSDSVMAAL